MASAVHHIVSKTDAKFIPDPLHALVESLRTYWDAIPPEIRDACTSLANELDYSADKSGRDNERRRASEQFCFYASLADHAVRTIAMMAVDRGFDERERATEAPVEAGKRAEAVHGR